MKAIKSLVRAYRANFEMPMPEEGVKMNFYTALGIIAVTCIMLPCCIIVGYLSYVMSLAMILEGNKVNGIIAEMHIIAAFSMILGMAVVFNVLFFSADREHLTALPIKSWELLAAKFNHTFMAESVMEFLVLLSMFIGYFIAALGSYGLWPSLHPIAIIAAVIGTATTPLLPLIYCTIISLILMNVLKKVRSIKVFYRSGTVLMLIFIALFLWSFKDMGGITMDNFLNSMAADNNFFLKICNVIFFTTPLLCRAMADQDIISLLLYIAGNAAGVGIMLLLGRFLYQPGLYAAAALGSVKRRNSMERMKKSLRKRSVFYSYFKKEWLVLIRTRAYSSNCVFINILWPAGIAAFFLITKKNESIQEFISLYREGYERASLILLCGVILVSFIASAMNTLATTAFTREGRHVDMIKYIPIPYETQLKVKGAVAVFITAPFLISSVIVAGAYLGFDAFQYLAYILLALAALIMATVVGLYMDSTSPHTLWEDEYSALRGNLNSFFNMAVTIVFSILLCGLAFLLYELLLIPLQAVSVIIILLLIGADALLLTFGSKAIIKNMEQLF